MPALDDRLRDDLERLAVPADPAHAFERVARKRRTLPVRRRASAAVLALTVLAASAGTGYGLYRAFGIDKPAAQPANPGPQPVTGVRNGLIAFVAFEGGDWDIFVMNPDGTGVRRVTDHPGEDSDPAWSPDGQWLLFNRGVEAFGSPAADLFIMDAAGANLRRLGPILPLTSAAWSPDGSRIAFTGPDHTLYVRLAPDGVAYRVTDIGASDPTWAPASNRLAFVAVDGIRILDLRSGRTSRVTSPSLPHDDRDPAWSPDGEWIAFRRPVAESEKPEIFLVRPDGTGLHRFTHNNLGEQHLSWSPDGSQLIFDVPGGEIHGVSTIKADGSDLREVREGWLPAWQPVPEPQPVPVGEVPTSAPANGSIAFLSDRDGGGTRIFAVQPDRSRLERLTPEPFAGEHLDWSPDGTRLIFDIGVQKGWGNLDEIRSDGTGRRTITNFADPQGAAWSPDGRFIVYGTRLRNPPGIHLWEDGGGFRQVTVPPGCADLYPEWSPDGRRIVFVRDCPQEDALFLVNISDWELPEDAGDLSPERLVSLDAPWSGGSWMIDGRTIAYASGGQIQLISADGGDVKTLTREGENLQPEWSPDGRYIAFSSNRDGNREVYVMEYDGTVLGNVTNHPADDFAPAWQQLPAPSPGGESGSACRPTVRISSAVSQTSGPPGTVVRASGPTHGYGKGGEPAPPIEGVQIWWNLEVDHYVDLLPGGPQLPAVRFLGDHDVRGRCQYDIEFRVPDVAPGRYPVLFTQAGGDGFAGLGEVEFEVTEEPALSGAGEG